MQCQVGTIRVCDCKRGRQKQDALTHGSGLYNGAGGDGGAGSHAYLENTVMSGKFLV